jgi:hypothetical protein
LRGVSNVFSKNPPLESEGHELQTRRGTEEEKKMEATLTTRSTETTELSPHLLEEIQGCTGLEEADGEDYKLPLYTFNMKWKDPKTGRPIPPDVFFHTVTEEYKPAVRCVLLRLKKSHRMASYIDGVGTRILCRSMDRITGQMEDGVLVPREHDR